MLFKTLTLLIISFVTIEGRTAIHGCNNSQLYEMNYTKTVHVEQISPNDIAVSHNTTNMYVVEPPFKLFVHTIQEEKSKEIVIPYCLVRTIAIANFDSKVYIGCDTGLKVYDEITGCIGDISGFDNIWELHMSRGTSELFIVSRRPFFTDSFNVFKYDIVTSEKINLNITVNRESYKNFAVDSKGNFYFKSKDNGGKFILNIMLRGNPETFEYTKHMGDITTDNQGVVYGILNRKLYRLKAGYDPKSIATLDFEAIGPMFINNNNEIFLQDFDSNSIVLLKLHYKSIVDSKAMPNECAEKKMVRKTFGNKQLYMKINELLQRRIEINKGVLAQESNMNNMKMEIENNNKVLEEIRDILIQKVNTRIESLQKQLANLNKKT